MYSSKAGYVPKLSIVDTIIKSFKVSPARLSIILNYIAPKVLHIITTTTIPTIFDDMAPQHIIKVDIDTTIILKLSHRFVDPTIQNVYEITYSKEWYLIYKSLNSVSTKSRESCLTISQINKKSKAHSRQRFSKFNLIIHVLMMISQHLIDDISLYIMSIFFESVRNKTYCNIYSLSSSNTWNLCYSEFCGSERFMIQCDDESKYEIQKEALQRMSIQLNTKNQLISHDNFEFEILNRTYNNKFESSEFITVYRNISHDTLGIIAYNTCNNYNIDLNDLMRDVYYKIRESSFFEAYVHKRYIYCSIPDNIEPTIF